MDALSESGNGSALSHALRKHEVPPFEPRHDADVICPGEFADCRLGIIPADGTRGVPQVVALGARDLFDVLAETLSERFLVTGNSRIVDGQK